MKLYEISAFELKNDFTDRVYAENIVRKITVYNKWYSSKEFITVTLKIGEVR